MCLCTGVTFTCVLWRTAIFPTLILLFLCVGLFCLHTCTQCFLLESTFGWSCDIFLPVPHSFYLSNSLKYFEKFCFMFMSILPANMCVPGACRGQRRALDSLNWSYGWLWGALWVPGTEHRLSTQPVLLTAGSSLQPRRLEPFYMT